MDQQLHLLASAQAEAARTGDHGRAACGRLIPANGLTLTGPSAGMCVSCIAEATTGNTQMGPEGVK